MSSTPRRLTATDGEAPVVSGKPGRAAQDSGSGMVSRAVPFTPEEIEELQQVGDDFYFI